MQLQFWTKKFILSALSFFCFSQSFSIPFVHLVVQRIFFLAVFFFNSMILTIRWMDDLCLLVQFLVVHYYCSLENWDDQGSRKPERNLSMRCGKMVVYGVRTCRLISGLPMSILNCKSSINIFMLHSKNNTLGTFFSWHFFFLFFWLLFFRSSL